MQLIRNTARLVFFTILCQITADAFGQVGVTPNADKKPKEYEERKLPYEKSDKGKFGIIKRGIHNTTTHYNYFFNANVKLQEVLEKAKATFKDDYSQLLPFYNYTLDVTAADSVTLDSISFKSQSGIALHDLRNDWADNMYLLWGISYHFKKQFDSAFLMFQFINFAFAPKQEDGYLASIGSAKDGNNAFSVVTKEKPSLVKKAFKRPPSRNDAFIWQIKNFLAQDLYAEAASLIVTLKNDPEFPSRLDTDLEEMQAYWFYKQKMWDSSAVHLKKALDNAPTKQERARWEYLLAQLYELGGKYKEAEASFDKAIAHTIDPILDIYARLYSIRVNKDGGDNYIEKNIATLVKMAKRDKYLDYRDIIYYMAAQMELERNNIDGALALLDKSTRYPSNDPSLRNRAFLQLAELSFSKRQYRKAYNYYDSLKMDDPALKDQDAITKRKTILGTIATNLEIIERQDSMQRIASLPENERRDFIRKLVRQLRREQGLKDEGTSTGSSLSTQPPPSLFPDKDKGEWYFYNSSSRQKGLQDFKARWGTRANQDNWRRSAAQSGISRGNKVSGNDPALNLATNKPTSAEPTEITFDGLYEKLPLTEELMKASNDSIQNAMFNLGIAYVQGIEDCTAGTETFEEIRTKFPQHPKMDEVLFNLYYCYNKNGETAKANEIKKLMNEKFSGSRYTTIVATGKDPEAKKENTDATKTYERIYDLFLEGKFDEALQQKKIADSLYSNNYWTPQLLYIQAVYHIRQREDSVAKVVLNDIINKFPASPLSPKSMTMLDVLNRRAQIEDELTKLVINRPPDDTVHTRPVFTNPVVTPPKDTVVAQKPVQPPPVVTNKPDTIAKTAQPVTVNFVNTPETPHYVVIVLNKVDPVYVNEARNAFANYNRNTYYNKQMTAELVEVDTDNRLLLVSPFKNAQEAVEYVDKTKPITSTQIVPWLKGGKFYYSIITDKNLDMLKASKALDQYKQFLDRNFPGKF